MQQVLIVDDNPSVCTALEILFDVHGIPTIVAWPACPETRSLGQVGRCIRMYRIVSEASGSAAAVRY